MDEKSLFIKLTKQEQVNELLDSIKITKEKTKQKVNEMKDILEKEKNLLDKFDESLRKIDGHMENTNNLLNRD